MLARTLIAAWGLVCHVTSFFESMLAREFNRGQMSQQEVEQPNARSTMPNVTSQRHMAMSIGIRSVVVISREKVCFLTISSSHIDPYFFSIICFWMHLPSPPPLASKSKRGRRQYAWYAFTTTTTSLALECQAAVDFLGASICLARLR